jgi:uncharacterized protein
MATSTLTTHILPGSLGEILVDVRAGGRDSTRPAVLVIHGFKGFKDWGMFPAFAERAARAGLTAVSLNMSGSGADAAGSFVHLDRFSRNTFSAELADVATVLDALARGELGVAPPSSVGLVGHSRGGGIAVLQTARDCRVRALVTWAAISTVERWDRREMAAWRERGKMEILNSRTGQMMPLFTDVLDDIAANRDGSLDIEAAAESIEVPWLIIHGSADESVPEREAEVLVAAGTSHRTELLRIDGAGHTFGAAHPFQPGEGQIDQVFDATLSWLSTSLV